jgi:hypothetical protein
MVQLSDVEDVIALLTALALRLEDGQPLTRW